LLVKSREKLMDLTDQRIRTDVMDRIAEEGIEVVDLKIDVMDGMVTLTGLVRAPGEKTTLGRRVAEIPGVLSVDNQLEIAEKERISYEAFMARRILGALVADPELAAADIEVTVSAQAAVLSGTVDSPHEKVKAERIAARMAGVLGIANNIAVAPASSPLDEQMARAVEDALERNEFVESENVQVQVEKGKVTLRGTVSTWEAKKAAYDAAVYASGSEEVEDDLEISELR
jgi:osmotically-inducible protein OsmY